MLIFKNQQTVQCVIIQTECALYTENYSLLLYNSIFTMLIFTDVFLTTGRHRRHGWHRLYC